VKILSVRLLWLLVFLWAPSAWAEGHSVGLFVGQVWPSGDMANGIDGAVTPGLTYEYEASEVFNAYASVSSGSHSTGRLKVTSTTVGMKAHLVYLDKLAPYALLGAGLYFVNRSVGNERAKTTNFGFHLGLGAELDLSERFFMGLQFDLHNLFAASTALPIAGRVENSGRWAGFFLRGGVRF
jgi:opacity protein-like surface antigen